MIGRTSSSDVIFHGLAKSNKGFGKYVKDRLGWSAHRRGEDWVVPGSDPALQAGPKDVLTIFPAEDLDDLSEAFQQRLIRSAIDDDRMRAQYHPNPDHISIPGNFGLRSEFDASLIKFFFSNHKNIIQSLEDSVKFLTPTVGAKKLFLGRSNFQYQQSLLSISKICLLSERFGATRSCDLIFNKGALRYAVPAPADLISFVIPFFCVSPALICLPYEHFSFFLLFILDRPRVLPHPLCSSLFDKLDISGAPLSSIPSDHMFLRMNLRAKEISIFAEAVLKGLNGLLGFANDVRNFTDATGHVEFLRQIQFYGSLWYCFSDFKTFALSMNGWARNNAIFGVCDKISNLRAQFGQSKSEGALWMGIFSHSHCHLVCDILDESLSSKSEYLARKLKGVAKSSLLKLHASLRRGDDDEFASLSRLRSFRNLRHGAYLEKNRFESLFLEYNGEVDQGAHMFVYCVMLAFLLNPRRFLSSPIVVPS